MTDTTQPTDPPPTPADALLSRTITALFILAALLVVAITYLVATDKAVPDVLGTMLTVAITALATLLAARTRP